MIFFPVHEFGIAVSEDMENWTLSGEVPFEYDYEAKGIGAPAAIVLDGKVHLFYQGSSDMGKTWYLSKVEIEFDSNNIPHIV